MLHQLILGFLWQFILLCLAKCCMQIALKIDIPENLQGPVVLPSVCPSPSLTASPSPSLTALFISLKDKCHAICCKSRNCKMQQQQLLLLLLLPQLLLILLLGSFVCFQLVYSLSKFREHVVLDAVAVAVVAAAAACCCHASLHHY